MHKKKRNILAGSALRDAHSTGENRGEQAVAVRNDNVQ